VQLNVAEAVIALKIKGLDDALGKAIQQMQSMQLKLAVLVRDCFCPLLVASLHATRWLCAQGAHVSEGIAPRSPAASEGRGAEAGGAAYDD
jgi:hypothetical protein